jgi:hypothetical protein
MKYKHIILIASVVLIVSLGFYFKATIHTQYLLEDVVVDGWHFHGGRIQLEGLTRTFEYEGLNYEGSDTYEVSRVGLELNAHSRLGNSKERLMASSMGEETPFVVDDNFVYGGGSGSTHSVSVLKSYSIKSVEAKIDLVKGDQIESVVIIIPVKETDDERTRISF